MPSKPPNPTRLQFAPLANQDLDEIFDYLSPRSEPAAQKLRQQFKEFLGLLLRNPRMGKLVHRKRGELRSFTVSSYVFFYRIDGPVIEIVRIIHGVRDLEVLVKSL